MLLALEQAWVGCVYGIRNWTDRVNEFAALLGMGPNDAFNNPGMQLVIFHFLENKLLGKPCIVCRPTYDGTLAAHIFSG